ncbi:MAG: hypothetical protein LBQ93_03345 [Treponema sp.]|jgi:hypothetical protein|nr:hypothetical protein [Treponema sp.]
MKTKQIVIALVALVMLAATAYASGKGEKGDNNPVIQTDRNRDSATIRTSSNLFATGGRGSLTINNQASFDVIIFAGKVSNNNVMGGIRAGQSRTFDLSTLSLPGTSGSFLIRATSFDQYSKRNARVTEEDVVYTGLVVFDLKDPRQRMNLNIFAGISDSQDEFVWVSNTSKFVLELRVGSPNGEKMATLAPFQSNKPIPLRQQQRNMPYEFYATYVYVDPQTNEIVNFAAKGMEERLRRTPSADRVNPMVFSGPVNTSQIAYLNGFLRVKNDTNVSFNLMDGTTWLFDQKGIPLVESGMLMTYDLPSLSGEAGQSYTNINMEFDNMKTLRINRFDVKPGVVYDLSVFMRDGNYVYDIRATERRDRLEDLQMSLFLGG